MWRAATWGSAITSAAELLGPAAMPTAVSSRAASSLCITAHAPTRADDRLEVRPAGSGREAGIVLPLGMADEAGQRLELVLA